MWTVSTLSLCSFPTHVLPILSVRKRLCILCVPPKFHNLPSRECVCQLDSGWPDLMALIVSQSCLTVCRYFVHILNPGNRGICPDGRWLVTVLLYLLGGRCVRLWTTCMRLWHYGVLALLLLALFRVELQCLPFLSRVNGYCKELLCTGQWLL